RCVRPLSQVGEQLEFLIKAREFVSRNGIPAKHDEAPA
ncbi:MAG TPA: TetR/AcrR family transcriptional regulator, partial [Mycobacterium sp.]